MTNEPTSTSEITVLGYMPQVFQDDAWTDLINKCVERLSTARTVTSAVRLSPTRVVERTVVNAVVR